VGAAEKRESMMEGARMIGGYRECGGEKKRCGMMAKGR
jgi:hypothetical protein